MVQWLEWLPSIAYPVVDPKEGWWYPQTSTINWCEEVSCSLFISHILTADCLRCFVDLEFPQLSITFQRLSLLFFHATSCELQADKLYSRTTMSPQ